MKNKLYLDDLRKLPDNSFYLARSYRDAINYVKEYGIPSFISFDHDLGVDSNNILLPSGYDFAKWLVEMDLENLYTFPKDFDFIVHSANPVGKNNIEAILNNYLHFKITSEL